MIIALYESQIVLNDKNANLDNLKQAIVMCKDYMVDLLLMPEMSLTGFNMKTDITGEYNRDTVNNISELSLVNNLAIGVGWVENRTDSLLSRNHYSIILKGEEISDYIKIHPFSYSGEDKYFEGGSTLKVCNVGDFIVGTTICYDLRFPEIYQKLSKKADLIIVPANWPAKRQEHYDTLLKARAIENMCYIAGINCEGMLDGQKYTGGTAIYNPNGQIVTPKHIININNAGRILIYELSNDTKTYRKAFPVKEDRREDLYNSIKVIL